MIQFIKEGNSIFAIEQNVERNGKYYEEIMWSELEEVNNKFVVTFEDDWKTKYSFDTLNDAKQFVINNIHKHNFHINGRVADI